MGLLNSFSFNMPVFEKYFFYIFNVYLMLRGICTLTWVTIVYLNTLSWTEYFNTWTKDIAIPLKILIVIGSVIIVFGFCGGVYSILFFDNAKFRNRCNYTFCITVTFASLFLIILIVQLVAAIYIFLWIPKAADNFKGAFMNYSYKWEDMKFVDNIQDRFYCCGIYSYRDYKQILNISIPGSCCYNSWQGCTMNNVKFRPGCIFRLNTSGLIPRLYVISIFTLTVTVAELIGFIFALYLANSIKKRNAMKRQETHPIHISSRDYF